VAPTSVKYSVSCPRPLTTKLEAASSEMIFGLVDRIARRRVAGETPDGHPDVRLVGGTGVDRDHSRRRVAVGPMYSMAISPIGSPGPTKSLHIGATTSSMKMAANPRNTR